MCECVFRAAQSLFAAIAVVYTVNCATFYNNIQSDDTGLILVSVVRLYIIIYNLTTDLLYLSSHIVVSVRYGYLETSRLHTGVSASH